MVFKLIRHFIYLAKRLKCGKNVLCYIQISIKFKTAEKAVTGEFVLSRKPYGVQFHYK